MKAFFILVMACVSSTSTAQLYTNGEHGLTALYAGFGGGTTTGGSLYGAHSTFILANNWGGSVNWRTNHFDCTHIPSDYSSGLVIFGDDTPDDILNSVSVHLLRNFPTKPTVRFIFEGGPAIIQYEQAHFTPSGNTGWFTSNYNVSFETTTSIGASLRVKVDWAFCRFIGLELASFSNLNAYHSYSGIELLLNVGFVRQKRNDGRASVRRF